MLIILLFLNLFPISAQKSIEVHFKFESCLTCNLPKLNSILKSVNNLDYNKNVIIYHNNSIEPMLYKAKIKFNFSIDTIRNITDNLIIIKNDSNSITYKLNEYIDSKIQFENIYNDFHQIKEDRCVVIDISSIFKSDSSFYLISNKNKSISYLSNFKFSNVYDFDSSFVKENIRFGQEYFNFASDYGTDFSIFEYLSYKRKKSEYLFKSIDSINFNKNKSNITIHYNYFTNQKDVITEIKNLPKHTYVSIDNDMDYHILQKQFDDTEFDNDLIFLIKNDVIKQKVNYSDLLIDSTNLVSFLCYFNNNLYLFNFKDNKLTIFNTLNNEIHSNILSNIPEKINSFEHIINEEYYIQLIQTLQNQYLINIYSSQDFKFIKTIYLSADNELELINLLDMNNNCINLLSKHKIFRWRISKIRI